MCDLWKRSLKCVWSVNGGRVIQICVVCVRENVKMCGLWKRSC